MAQVQSPNGGALPVISAQQLGGFGSDPSSINFTGATPQDLENYQEALQGALGSLQQRVAAPNWANIAAGFLKPQLGGFAAGLGSAEEALGRFVEQRRQMALPIAQLRAQLAQSKIAMDQNQQAANLWQQWQQQNPDPNAVPPPGLIARMQGISPTAPATRAAAAQLAAAQHTQDLTQAQRNNIYGLWAKGIKVPAEQVQAAGIPLSQAPQGLVLGAPGVAGPAAGTPPAAPSATPGAPAPNPLSPNAAGTTAPGGGFDFNANGGYGALAQAYLAGHVSPQQAATVLQDMHSRGEVPDDQYAQMMRTFELDNGAPAPAGGGAGGGGGGGGGGGAGAAPAGQPPAPQPVGNAHVASPPAMGGLPLDPIQTPPSQPVDWGLPTPSWLQEAQVNPNMAAIAKQNETAVQPQVQAVTNFGNPQSQQLWRQNISNALDLAQSDSKDFNYVLGRLMKNDAVLNAVGTAADQGAQLSLGDLHGAVGLPIHNFLNSFGNPKQLEVAQNVLQAVADYNYLYKKMQGAQFNVNIPASEANLLTEGTLSQASAPDFVKWRLANMENNLDRYRTLYDGSQYLRTHATGTSVAPDWQIVNSQWWQRANKHYDDVNNQYDQAYRHALTQGGGGGQGGWSDNSQSAWGP